MFDSCFGKNNIAIGVLGIMKYYFLNHSAGCQKYSPMVFISRMYTDRVFFGGQTMHRQHG